MAWGRLEAVLIPVQGGRCAILAVLVAAMTTTTLADGGGGINDAGTGGDAGDTRAQATAVGIGTLYGATFTTNDIDWFAAPLQSSGPACVLARVHSSTLAYFALAAETAGGATTAPLSVGQGEEGVGGVAGLTPLTATLRVRRDPAASSNNGQYDFRLDRVGLSASSGDAGGSSDASEGSSGALAAGPGCTSGRLPALDMGDAYAIQVPAGRAVTYSLGANTTEVSLTLVDALGQKIGPAVGPGEFATVDAPASGTYYMTAQRTSITEVSYVIGAIVGPEPSGCRPLCVDG